MWLRLFAGVSVLALFFASPALAEPFRLGPVYTDRPGEVSVVVEFKSPPGDLPPSYFHLVEGDKSLAIAREIKSFKDSGEGLALIICVDVSGSMKSDPLVDTKQTLLSFRAKVRPQDRIALVSFADEDRVESSFEDPREQLEQAIRSLKPRGTQTKLRQTLYKALDMFEGAKVKVPKRRRLLVISDGKDEGSVENIQNVVDKATKSSFTPIDVVGRGKIAPQFTEVLQSLAYATGGRFAHARPDRLTLTDAVDLIYSSLSETHSLVVYFSYEKDAVGRKISDASIQLREEPPTSKRILGEIPWSLEPPPPPDGWLSWLLFTVLLAIILAVVILAVVIHRRQKVEERVGPRPGSSPEPGRPSGRQRDATLVGRYLFLMPEPGKPTTILRAVSGPLEGKQFFIEKESFDIGVSSENDLCIAQDNYMSEKHASLRYEKGSLRLYDQGSKNGTFVNQNKVPESGVALSLNDRIRVGMSTFEVAGTPQGGHMENEASRTKRDRTAVGDVLPAGERPETKVMSPGAAPRPSEQSGKGDSRRIVGMVITYTWRPEGQLFPIYEGRNLIGRADMSSEAKPGPCDIQIPHDTQMSAEHTLILCRQGSYEIIDQETTNGTLVNGELLQANLPAELPNYAKVRTGATEWTFIRINAPQGGEGLAPSHEKGGDLRC